jgi:hypothetical protein
VDATITQAEMSSIQGKVNVVAFGTALVPSTVATYDNGATVDFPGSAPGTGAALTFENVRLLDITGEQWFTDSRDPAWRMKVAPSPGP